LEKLVFPGFIAKICSSPDLLLMVLNWYYTSWYFFKRWPWI